MLELADLAVKGTALCVAVAVGLVLMRRASAASRHLLLTAMFAGIVLLPIARLGLPALTVRVLAPMPASPASSRPPTEVSLDDRQPAVTFGAGAPADAIAPAAPLPRPSWLATALAAVNPFVAIWITGVVVLLIRAAIGARRVRRLGLRAIGLTDASTAARVEELKAYFGERRRIKVLVSTHEWMPMTWGVVRPTILLPSSVLASSDECRSHRDAILIHEIAHIARLDAVAQWIATVAVAIGWFNPLVWLAARQARLERERACDDAVLAHGARASDYADQLLTLARTLAPAPIPPANALAMARTSHLEQRMYAILDAHRDRRGCSRTSSWLAAILILVTLPVAAVRVAARVPVEPAANPVSEPIRIAEAPSEPPAADFAQPAPVVRLAQTSLPTQGPRVVVDQPRPADDPRSPAQGSHAAFVVPQPNYVVGVGDVLAVTVWREPRVSGDVRVQSNGAIRLSVGQDIRAAGLTLDELKASVTKELKLFYPDPDVFVQVKQINSRIMLLSGSGADASSWRAVLQNRQPTAGDLAGRVDRVRMARELVARGQKHKQDAQTMVEIGTMAAIDVVGIDETVKQLQDLAAWAAQSPPTPEADLPALRERFAAALRDVDFAGVRFTNGLASSAAVREALMAAAAVLRASPQSDADVIDALKDAAGVTPETARAEALLRLAQRYAFTPDMVALYVAAANGLTSSAERARVFAQPIRVKAPGGR